MKLALAVLLAATAFGQVSFDRISNADKEPVAEITAENVSRLKVKWAHQFPDPNNEVSPNCLR